MCSVFPVLSPAVSVVFCFRFLGLLSSFLNHTHQRNAFASRTNAFVLSVPLLVKSRPENRPPMSAYARVRSVATLSPPSPQQTFTCTYIRLLSFPLFLGVCVRWFANMRRRTCGVNRVCVSLPTLSSLASFPPPLSSPVLHFHDVENPKFVKPFHSSTQSHSHVYKAASTGENAHVRLTGAAVPVSSPGKGVVEENPGAQLMPRRRGTVLSGLICA